MSERYSKLFSPPENLYAQGAPVVIAAGAMLRDNERDRVLVQLKFRSIAPGKTNVIRAVKVHIEPLDTAQRPMDCAMDYQYLDLNAGRGEEFGAQTPVYLSDSTARSFRVSVTEAVLSTGIWSSDGGAWEPLTAPTTLEIFFKNAELEKQYCIKYGSNSRVLPRSERGLWYCACGTLNRDEEPMCCTCHRGREQCLAPIDLETLQAEMQKRLEAEQAEAEKRRQEAEAQAEEEAKQAEATAKKIRKITAIATVVALAAAGIFAVVKYIVIPNRDYNAAMALYESGDYDAAIAAFQAMDGYKDSEEKVVKIQYAQAEKLLNDGKTAQAALAFNALGNCADAQTRCLEAWDKAAIREAVSVRGSNTAGMKTDGTVVAVGYNKYGQSNVSSWTDIVAISAGGHTVGLQADGTVVAVGHNEYGECDVSNWTDIVAVSVGTVHTVGLKADGTVVAVGDNTDGQCDVSDWTDIIAISAGGFYTVGLKADGTVVAVGYNKSGQCSVSDWTDIISVSAGDYLTVGLKEDGTVVATGSNLKGECNVSDWKNIVAVSTGYTNLIGSDSYLYPAGLSVGLRSDGTVVATGYNTDGQCNVSSWKDIAAISVGSVHTVGLKSDGTVVATGSNKYGQCDVSDWTDIIAVYAEDFYTVGLKADGTVVAVGDNTYGQCDVSDWTNIKLPEGSK